MTDWSNPGLSGVRVTDRVRGWLAGYVCKDSQGPGFLGIILPDCVTDNLKTKERSKHLNSLVLKENKITNNYLALPLSMKKVVTLLISLILGATVTKFVSF